MHLECGAYEDVRMQRRPQQGGRGRVHPRSTVLQEGASWIQKNFLN